MRYRASTYRLLVSVFVVLVAICCIFPVRDRPFEKYVTSHVTNDKKEFDDLQTYRKECKRVAKEILGL